MTKQPALINDWGVPFYGKAETATGNIWWYTDKDGTRHPLRPAAVEAAPPTCQEVL